MKRRFPNLAVSAISLLYFAVGALSAIGGTDPGDQFLQAYLLTQNAKSLERIGDLKAALRKYELALKLLEDIEADYSFTHPDHSHKNLREKIRALRQRLHISEPSPKYTYEA